MKITSFPMNRPVCLLFKSIYNLHPILLSICCITAPSRLCPEFNLERRCAMKKNVIAGTIVVSLLAALIILKKKGEM